MSFQAYLDAVETKTGKTPDKLIALAREKGFGPDTKATPILFELGRGHGMAVVHVIKNGAEISEEHVGTEGTHRDESSTLRLSGKDGGG